MKRAPSARSLEERMEAADWGALAREMDDLGCALMPRLLAEDECAALASMYHEAGLFRATIEMKRYRFGEGEYRYFKAPLPEPVGTLRRLLYPRLLPIARDWHQRLGREAPWPGRGPVS